MSGHQQRDDETADKVLHALDVMYAYGRRRARTQAEIAGYAGVSVRKLQICQESLLKRDVPIVSACDDPPGIFIAETPAEIKACCDQLQSRIVGNAVHLKELRRLWRKRIAEERVEPDGQHRLAIG